MTKRIGKVLLIEEEKPQQCDVCGEIAELRPYGPNGEKVCFRCGMEHEESAKGQFYRRLG